MQVVALRGRIDRFWLACALAWTVWSLACFYAGETYDLGRYGGVGWVNRVSDPDLYWRNMTVSAVLGGWFFLLCAFRSPLQESLRERVELRMTRERLHPVRRSLLWKAFFYVALPFALVFGLFYLAISAG